MSLYAEHLARLSSLMRAHAAEAENLAAGLSVEGNPDLIPHLQARLDALCRTGELPSFSIQWNHFGDTWALGYSVFIVLPGGYPSARCAMGQGPTPDDAVNALIPNLTQRRAEALTADRAVVVDTAPMPF